MASKNDKKTIKNNPELFSEENPTVSDSTWAKVSPIEINDLTNINQVIEEQLSDLPSEDVINAQELVSSLLDKYYNGDRDVDISQRFAKKEEYKGELIQTLKQYGICYIEKYHYPLSKDEKHIIRMDFFGTINQPRYLNLTPLYRGYLNFKQPTQQNEQSQKTTSDTKKKRSKTNKLTPQQAITYPLSSYDLTTSPSWNLFRLFPRFHKLENKMLKTIQSLHIPPEQLKLLSVYDFSDLLYRTFRKSEDSHMAHLFLGARNAFVKDVFKKHEQWIRRYLESKNVHPRYINALIKSAQSKGVCNDINVTTDTNTYMSEYVLAHEENFKKYIIDSIRSDDYATDIRSQIQSNAFAIQGSALHFLQNTQNQFKKHIKKQILEDDYINILYEQFNKKTPPFILKDIKSFLQRNFEYFSDYVIQSENTDTTPANIIKKIPNNLSIQNWKTIKSYIQYNQDEFYSYLIDQNRSIEYASLAMHSLSKKPTLTDYSKDLITSFILANEQNFKKNIPNATKIFEELKDTGLSDDILIKITPFIRNNYDTFKTFFKENNILTYTELQRELIEGRKLVTQNTSIPESMHQLNKNFVLSNSSIFKDWYINFHTTQYKENAKKIYKEIEQKGINKSNAELCNKFIQERLSSFIEFAQKNKIPTNEIISAIKNNSLYQNKELKKNAHQFIIQYSSTFKNFLLQNHLEKKENNFDQAIKNIKHHAISEQSAELIHKFILDNQALYTQYQRNNKQITQQTETIYGHIINNKSSPTEKNILNTYLNDNIYNYMIFQQDDNQLIPYVQNIIHNIKHTIIDSTEEHWLKAYTNHTLEEFKNYMISQNYIEDTQSNTLIEDIQQQKNHLNISFNDGCILKMLFTVHHKNATKDSGELKQNMENIAQINDFSNLCIFLDFWHKIMHSMDCIEPIEDRERYVARLMPSQPNVIFFGSEQSEDQLCYDYKSDPRSQRYDRHLTDLVTNINTASR